jgi:hypothetical protein
MEIFLVEYRQVNVVNILIDVDGNYFIVIIFQNLLKLVLKKLCLSYDKISKYFQNTIRCINTKFVVIYAIKNTTFLF